MTLDIKRFFKRFSPIETYLWLNIIAIHPNNQDYQSRFRFLIGLLLSIPEDEFQSRIPGREVWSFFFNKISESFASIFEHLEDFQGFSQNLLIPIFHKSDRYYFFYGDLERPFELYKSFFDLYFIDYDDAELEELKIAFIESLSFQTNLLSHISTLEESNVEADGIYIPTHQYFDEIVSLFLRNPSNERKSLLSIGAFKEATEQDILEQASSNSLFKSTVLYNSNSNQQYYIMPQAHIEVFLHQGREVLTANNEVRRAVRLAFKQRIINLLNKLFKYSGHIKAVFLVQSHDNILMHKVDYAALVDSNKLVLFAAVEHSLQEEISANWAMTIERLNQVAELISQNEIIGVLQPDDKTVIGYPGKQLEIFLCPIFESINFNYFAKSSLEISFPLFPFSFMDLTAVVSKLKNPFNFLKFLREESNLKAKLLHPILGEFMERFAYYIENGNAYSRSGQEINAIFFEPHSWHFLIMQELYEKYKDEAYGLIEKKFSNFFNVIEKKEDRVYRMMNTAYLEGAYLVRWASRNVWLFGPPNGYGMGVMEAQVTYDVLTMLYAEYLDKLRYEFENAISFALGSEVDYSIFIIPIGYIVEEVCFPDLKYKVAEISTEFPMVFDTRKIRDKLQTVAIFNYEHLPVIFGHMENHGERYCVKELLESIYLYCSYGEDEADKMSQLFIDKHVPVKLKRYSVELLSHSNPHIGEYRPPARLNDTDTGIIIRKISEFLIAESFLPGDYNGSEAQRLIGTVCNFLQNYLEENIRTFNDSLLIFAYSQLELVYGDIENSKIRTGTQAKGNVDFNVIDSQREQSYKNTSLAAIIKHIIHSLLKTGMHGIKHTMNENWTYLLSISNVLLEMAYIFDNIKYDLRGHVLRIDNNYILSHKLGDEIFDSFTYQQDKATDAVQSAMESHTKAKGTEEQIVLDNLTRSEELIKLNKAFIDDFSFKYEDLLFVLFCLRGIQRANSNYFPLVHLKIDELVKEIKNADTLDIPDDNIRSIIDFISLKVGIYAHDFSLLPSNMMQYKERINLSPFVSVKDGILFGRETVFTSANFWDALILGDLPFRIPEDSEVSQTIKVIHKKIDKELEIKAENKAKEILGDYLVEARIDNFKRLSKKFKSKEDCGEIDVLCVNPDVKTVFVLDAKNVNKRVSPHYIKRNIDEFILNPKSYYNKLMKKKRFIEDNLEDILKHFNQNSIDDWNVKEAFITNNKHFAAYYINTKIDFVEIADMHVYLTQ